MSAAPSPPPSVTDTRWKPTVNNLFQRLFLIVVASVLLTVILSLFVFAQLKDDLRTLHAELKTAKEELATLATKEELEKRLQADLETVAATKKTLA